MSPMYKSSIPGAIPVRLTDLQWARRKASPWVRVLVLDDDPWERLMRDSDGCLQSLVLWSLVDVLSEPQMRALLDWMAQHYAKCRGWMHYAWRETEPGIKLRKANPMNDPLGSER